MTAYVVHDGTGTVLAASECRYVYMDGEHDEDAVLASKDRYQAIWVVHISHRHGDDISIHASYEGAWRAVVDFAAMYWDDDAAVNIHGDVSVPFPEDDEQAVVDGYFDGNEHEFYEIEQRLVTP